MINPKTMIKLKLRSDLHILRKLWHISTGLIGLSIYQQIDLPQEVVGKGLLIFSAIAFLVEIIRLKFSSINKVFMIFLGAFMRESERSSISGLPFYALGVATSLYFFSEHIAICSIMFLIFADPICSFIGILYGQEKILPNKSLEGSAAGFITCYFITFFYAMSLSGPSFDIFLFSIFAGIIGASSELLSLFVDDNLTIPIVSGLGLTFLNVLLPIF